MATNTVDTLKIEVVADAGDASKALANLSRQLTSLSGKFDKFNSSKFTSGINALSNGFNSLSQSVSKLDTKKIDEFANSIKSLGSASTSKAIDQLPRLASVVSTVMTQISRVTNVDQKIIDMTNALANLSAQANGLQKLASAATQAQQATASLNTTHATSENGVEQTVTTPANAAPTVNATQDVGKSVEEATPKVENFNEAFKSFVSGFNSGGKGILSFLNPFNKFHVNLGTSFTQILRYAFGIRSLFVLFNKLRSAFALGSSNLVGYSKEYASAVNSMSNALYTLKNASAVAFAPIVEAIAPYVTTLINYFTNACNAIGRFWAALTGKEFAVQATTAYDHVADAASSTASSAKDATDAVEKLLGLQGFDKLNNLTSPSSSSSGSGGSGGSGSGTLSYKSMFTTASTDDMKDIVEEVKKAWANSDFSGIGETIATKISTSLDGINWNGEGGIKDTAKKIATCLATFLTGGDSGEGFINPSLFGSVGTTIAEALNTAVGASLSFAEAFDGEQVGESLASAINNFFETFDTKQFADSIDEWVAKLKEIIVTTIEDINWGEVVKSAIDFGESIDFGTVTFALSVVWGLKLGGAVLALTKTTFLSALASTFGGTLTGETLALSASSVITLGVTVSLISQSALNEQIKNATKNGWKTEDWFNLNETTNAALGEGKLDTNTEQTVQDFGAKLGKKFAESFTTGANLTNSLKITWNAIVDYMIDAWNNRLAPAINKVVHAMANIPGFESLKDFDATIKRLENTKITLPVEVKEEDANKDVKYLKSNLNGLWKKNKPTLGVTAKADSMLDINKTVSRQTVNVNANATGTLETKWLTIPTLSTGIKATGKADLSGVTVNNLTTGLKATGTLDTSGIKIPSFSIKTTAEISNITLSKQAQNQHIVIGSKTTSISPARGATPQALGGAYYNGKWHSIDQYASGGIPTHGTHFIAGENGAEVVGHINNRTEVLNQSQMASAIASGVAKANANGANQVVVVLEGDADGIFKVVRQSDRKYRKTNGHSAFAY